VEFAGFVPSDDRITEYDLNGTPLVQLPDDSKALSGYFAILDRLIA
jgi:CO dehydrogenase nickel-insertion accessory protein CooC1